MILNCHLIQLPIILDRSELTILLFDEEEGCGHRRFRGLYSPTGEVFVGELVKLFLFGTVEWVDLAVKIGISIWDEFDSMISWFWFR